MALAWMPSCLCELRPELRTKCPAQCSWRESHSPAEPAVSSVQAASRFFPRYSPAVRARRRSPHFASTSVQPDKNFDPLKRNSTNDEGDAEVCRRPSYKDILFLGQAPPPPKPIRSELSEPRGSASDSHKDCAPSFRPFMGPSERRLAALAGINVAELWRRCDRHNLLPVFPGPQVSRSQISTRVQAASMSHATTYQLHDDSVCDFGGGTVASSVVGVSSVGSDVDGGRSWRLPRQAHKSGGDLFPAAEGRVAALGLLAFAATSAARGVPRSSRFSRLSPSPTGQERYHKHRSSSQDVTDQEYSSHDPRNASLKNYSCSKCKSGMLDEVCGHYTSTNASPEWKTGGLFSEGNHEDDIESDVDTEAQRGQYDDNENKEEEAIDVEEEVGMPAREYVGDDGGCLTAGHLPDLGRYRTVVLLGLHVATAFGLKKPKLFDQRTIKINVGLHADFLSAVARPGAGPALQAALADVDSDDDNDDEDDDEIDHADNIDVVRRSRLQTCLGGHFSNLDKNSNGRNFGRNAAEGLCRDSEGNDSDGAPLYYPGTVLPSSPSNRCHGSRDSQREITPKKRREFGVSAMRQRWLPKHKAKQYLRVRVCVLPHPSGVSHYWNDRTQRLRAARALRRLLHVALPDEPGAEETRDSLQFLTPGLEDEARMGLSDF